MKKLLLLVVVSVLIFTGCDVPHRSYNRGYADAPIVAAEPVFYSGCAVPGMGYLGDNGRYYPNGWTYRCDGMLYRSGMLYHGSLLGNMIVGAYFLSSGPGYGHYGRTHNTFIINKNVTVVKKGSSSYKKRKGRYNKISKQRKNNGFSTRKAKLRKKAQTKRNKAIAKRKKTAKSRSANKRKSNSFSRSYKSKPTQSRSKPTSRKSRSSFSRKSSRSSSRSSSRRRSDLRFKRNIRLMENSLSKVSSLNGVRFSWRNDQFTELEEEGEDIGLIAQDVHKVFPEVVSKGDDGYYRVAYDKLVPVLIEAIKEQQKQIDSLKKMIK